MQHDDFLDAPHFSSIRASSRGPGNAAPATLLRLGVLFGAAFLVIGGCGDDTLPVLDASIDGNSVDARPDTSEDLDGGTATDSAGRDGAEVDAAPLWVDLPSSFTIGEGERMRLAPPAGLEVRIASSTLPVHVDDEGVVIFAPYGEQRGTVEVELDAPPRRRRASLDITIEPLAWGPALAPNLSGPSPREHAAHVLDVAHTRMIVIAGSGYRPQGIPLGDVWAMDLRSGAWTEPTAEGEVPARGSLRVAQEEGASFALLHGGYNAPGEPSSNELVRVDFADEEIRFEVLRQSGDVPSARSLHSFFFDAATNAYWLFGGLDNPFVYDDLYRMELIDGAAVWTRVDLEGGPSARYGFFYGFDAEDGRLYVYSGAQSILITPAQDLWMLDVRGASPSWTQLLGDAELPLGRRNGSFAFDPRGPRLWVYGGTPDARRGSPGLFAIDFDESEGDVRARVVEVRRPHPMPNRSSGFGLFDSTADRVLMGFGNDADIYADVWPIVTGEGASTLPDACVDLGDSCNRDSCSTTCVEETSVDYGRNEVVEGLPDGVGTEFPAFAGGYCTPVAPRLGRDTCDPQSPTAECGTCAECVNFGGRPMCALRCEPSETDNGGCRDGYSCDPRRRVCLPGCSSDEQCRFRRRESNGEPIRLSFDECRDDPARCPSGPDALVYSTEGNPTCNLDTYRCEYEGTAGAEAGDDCTVDTDCEDNGECIPDVGRCIKRDCDVAGGTCAGDGHCISRTFGEDFPSFCGEPCIVGTGPGVDPEDPSTWRVDEGGCRPGDSCVWDFVTPPGEINGYCAEVGAGVTDVMTPNLGQPCTTSDECFSPFGRGGCEEVAFNSGTPGMCVLFDCDSPGLPALLTDPLVCLHPGGFDSAGGLGVPRCASADECAPERACTDFTGEGPVCIDICFSDENCRGTERCDAALRRCVAR